MSVPTSFVGSRVVRRRLQQYDAPPSIVFPLHGFREERAWAVGWNPEYVHPPDGAPAPGAVFLVRRGGADEVWVLTRWEPEQGRLSYVHVTPDRDVTVIDIVVGGPQQGPSHVEVTYTWTGLSPSGNAYVEAQTEEAFRVWMGEWEQEMTHYLATGRQLSR